MTNKNNQKESKADSKKVPTAQKMILFEAVQMHEEQNPLIIGALSKAGLLTQYRHEKHAIITGTEDVSPSITMNELNNIIKKFKGE